VPQCRSGLGGEEKKFPSSVGTRTPDHPARSPAFPFLVPYDLMIHFSIRLNNLIYNVLEALIQHCISIKLIYTPIMHTFKIILNSRERETR